MPPTALAEVKIGGPEQVELSGPKRLKVMVPVGSEPPARTAVSEMAPPAAANGVARVVIVGPALATVEVSPGSLQVAVVALLAASPPYAATQLYAPGRGGLNETEG